MVVLREQTSEIFESARGLSARTHTYMYNSLLNTSKFCVLSYSAWSTTMSGMNAAIDQDGINMNLNREYLCIHYHLPISVLIELTTTTACS